MCSQISVIHEHENEGKMSIVEVQPIDIFPIDVYKKQPEPFQAPKCLEGLFANGEMS